MSGERHANTRRYTWRKTNPTQGSRIDYAFVSQSMIDSYIINRVEIKPCIHSDHSLVNIEMSMHCLESEIGFGRNCAQSRDQAFEPRHVTAPIFDIMNGITTHYFWLVFHEVTDNRQYFCIIWYNIDLTWYSDNMNARRCWSNLQQRL